MRAPRSVHTYLVWLIAGVLLPLLAFSSFLVIRSATHEQDALATLARNRSRIAAAAIEDQLSSFRARLFLLAGGLSLQTSDLNEFHKQAKATFGDMTVILSSATGKEIVNTSVPYGEILPAYPDLDTIHKVAETQRSWISGQVYGEGHAGATISVPVTKDSNLVYVLSLDISSTLPRVLNELELPDGWIAGIFDGHGYMIARSRDADRFVGTLALPTFLNHIHAENNGWVPGVSREGVPLFNAFAHTRLGGWTINVGIPREVLLAPVRQTTQSLVLLGFAIATLAILLAVLIGRRIARAVIDLVPMADAVGRGEPVLPRHSFLREANVVADALHVAGEKLRDAATEQTAATSALTERERMYRVLSENLAQVDAERTALLNRVVVAQESERKRIARELHDSLAQYLTALRLKLDAFGHPDVPRREAVNELRSLTDELGRAVSRMAWELRPVALDELGLGSAVDHYLEEWAEMARMPVDVAIDLGERTLPPAVETTVFRVLQEATTNVLRHAGASHVGIVLEVKGDVVRLIVEDNGKGFSANDGGPSFGATRQFGLLGMRERLALVHGELEVESAPECGTTLFVSISLASNQAGQRQDAA